ncbi:hypothetical protein M408DRAFT_308347 [Serendipita vermifera MAFF 305830]|uniref:MalT-like TPR region domain-containing protein n=1 Tax=Serendipita vermifera MAFF 305830 TaxID=933852 RepID=A0A0C3B8F7_SERVB|nr:hypothetical protein M408DRAFT_308347 [Serendipita vermifera MAFF 305830]
MDSCIKSSRQASRITIDHLYHTGASSSRSSHGLPPLSTFFVARRQPMETIVNSLQSIAFVGQRVVVIVDMGGSGKTQIALKYGYDYDNFILSFVHFMDFPQPLFALAASYGFAYEPQYLLERGEDYLASIDQLKSIFCPEGDLLNCYPPSSSVTSCLGQDRLSETEITAFRGAAVRLLSCGTNYDDDYLWEYLLSHFKYISPFNGDLHVNDRGALAAIARRLMSSHELVSIWKDLYSRVKQIHGENHIQASQAALGLADSYGTAGDREKMEEIEREVAKVRTTLLGEEHSSTLHAIGNLARTLQGNRDYEAAAELEVKVLDDTGKIERPDHRALVLALSDLAWTRASQGLNDPAIILLQEALEVITAANGKAHPPEIRVMEQLYSCYESQGNTDQLEKLGKKIHALKKQLYGVVTKGGTLRQNRCGERSCQGEEILMAIFTMILWVHSIGSGEYLVQTRNVLKNHVPRRAVYAQDRFEEAATLWKEEVVGTQNLMGKEDVRTLKATGRVALALFKLRQYEESEKFWRQEWIGRQKSLVERDNATLNTLYWVARCLYEQGCYSEARELRNEQIEKRQVVEGKPNKYVLDAQCWAARCLFENMYKEAEEIWREELAGRRELHGDNESFTLGAIHWLARAAYAQRRYEEAEALWGEELQGPTGIEMKKYPEAELLRKEQLEGRRETVGPLANNTMRAMFSLSRTLFRLEKYEEAEKLLREELQCRRQVCGDQHTDTHNTIHWLGRALYEQGKYEEPRRLWEEN